MDTHPCASGDPPSSLLSAHCIERSSLRFQRGRSGGRRSDLFICSSLGGLVPRFHPHNGHLDEVVLFFAFGILIGLLVDRERLETQLRQDQEHLAVLGEAAATIAHELKNPVITIGAYVQKLLRKTNPEDPNRERLAVINRECQRIEIMLQDMIHFSRPIDADFSFVDINHLIQEVLKTIHPRAEQNQILLVSNLEEDLPSIQADHTRLTQVLHNLILNAIQASCPEQPVLVRTRTTERTGYHRGDGPGLRYSAGYSGKGIRPFLFHKKRRFGTWTGHLKKDNRITPGPVVFPEQPASRKYFHHILAPGQKESSTEVRLFRPIQRINAAEERPIIFFLSF